MEVKKKTSGLVILIWFIVFWPVGIYLIIKNMSNGEPDPLMKVKVLMGFGIFFLIASIAMLSQLSSDEISADTAFSGFVFYLLGGILLIVSALRAKARVDRREMLVDIEEKTRVNGNVNGKPKKVKCQNCGGENVFIEGEIHKCDYCTTPLL